MTQIPALQRERAGALQALASRPLPRCALPGANLPATAPLTALPSLEQLGTPEKEKVICIMSGGEREERTMNFLSWLNLVISLLDDRDGSLPLAQQRGQRDRSVRSPGGMEAQPREGEHHHQEERSRFVLRSITFQHSKSSKHCCERCELTSNFNIRVHPGEPLGHPSLGSRDGKRPHPRPSKQRKLRSRDGRTPHSLYNHPAGSTDK